MNTDIRVSTSVLSNPKISKLIRRKGHTGFYNLTSLWIHVALHNPSGKLVGLDDEDIMEAASTTDEKFVPLLVELGLLNKTKSGYEIHNWFKHNSWAMGSEKRSESARGAARARWEKKSA